MLKAGKHAALDLVYEIENAIAGHILDPGGNPMKDVCAKLLPVNKAGSKHYFDDFDCSDPSVITAVQEEHNKRAIQEQDLPADPS